MKEVFLSTGLATNGSANYREAAAPCKPAAKAAVGSQATAVPKVYACRQLFAFAWKCRRSLIRWCDMCPARISASGSDPEAVTLLSFHRVYYSFVRSRVSFQ